MKDKLLDLLFGDFIIEYDPFDGFHIEGLERLAFWLAIIVFIVWVKHSIQ